MGDSESLVTTKAIERAHPFETAARLPGILHEREEDRRLFVTRAALCSRPCQAETPVLPTVLEDNIHRRHPSSWLRQSQALNERHTR